MLKTTVLLTFLAFAVTGISADRKVVCYYGTWAAYRPGLGKFEVSDINANLCTHVVYTFVGINTEGGIKILDSWLDLPSGKDGFRKFVSLRQSNPGLKAMVAIGGWNEGSASYSQVVENPALRAKFVSNVVNFLKEYGFDGFDVDWEYPNQRGGKPADKENYVALLRELRTEFDKNGYLLSVAVAAAESSASQSYLIPQVSQHVHFINLMAYDFYGSWNNFAGINAPLYGQDKLNVDSGVSYWLSQGASADKIVLGIPTYGRSFTLANAGNNGVGAPTVGAGTAGPYTREAGMLGYNEICENLRAGGWTVNRDSFKIPYAFKGNQWVGYDDAVSIQEKVNYIKSKNLGGAMIWSIETDDFHGTCGEKYVLLNTINRVLGGSNAHDTTNVPPVVVKTTTTTTTTVSPPLPTNGVCKTVGYVRDPTDCSTFYYCQLVGGKFASSVFHCPSGLAFDPSFNGCNYKNLVPGCA